MKLPGALVIVFALAGQLHAQAVLPEAPPEKVGLDAKKLARIDATVERAIAEKKVPGAVVLVGRHGKIAYARALGRRAIEPQPEPMTRDTVFDMASLTKPVATATSVMILIERGRVRLDDPLVRFLPEFDNHGKRAITIEQLLRHRAGLIADNALGDYADGPEKAWEKLARIDLVSKPGERFLYSDVSFLILGRLVERVTGQDLARFSRENVFEPLGMARSAFRPIGADNGPVDRVAPTEKEGGRVLRGTVHDPRARSLGGVAGHAGLFGTADDLAVYAQMLLSEGRTTTGRALLAPATVRAMIDPGSTPERQKRGLGWDIATSFSSPRGSLFGPRSFGHTGFTGTSVWIDPDTDTFVIILASRLHPDGKAPSPVTLRAEIATLAASAIVDVPLEAARGLHPVACGIDVLARDGFAPLRGKRVGLITNHTGRTRDGESTIDVVFKAPGVKLVALFSPEHGIRGVLDMPVGDGWDSVTGLPITSLYGKRQKPTPAMLEGVDILVYDIQDIGARFYTYISTLGLALEAAREKGIPLVVLDRPNPIGGLEVAGPVRDAGFESFIAHHALPVRHGMTVGELARLFNGERKIGAELLVVPCDGWSRGDFYDRTGLLWINPSPNMRSLTEALLYPGVGLLEASNLATGRGTDTPFERVGAPWIDPRGFSHDLNALSLPGVRFVPVEFTPRERQYANMKCGGVQILITDWSRFEPISLGVGIAVTLRARYREHWEPAGFLKMLADRAAHQSLLDGRSVAEIGAVWESELNEFRQLRERYLLYK